MRYRVTLHHENGRCLPVVKGAKTRRGIEAIVKDALSALSHPELWEFEIHEEPA